MWLLVARPRDGYLGISERELAIWRLWETEMCLYNSKPVAAVGFEPTPPKRLVPKTSALDRSATLPIQHI